MAEGFRIASAFVEVRPETEGFREALQQRLDEATAGARATARVGLDTADFDARLGQVRARLDEIGGRTAYAAIGLATSDFNARMDAAHERLVELGGRTAYPTLGLATADFNARLDDARTRLDALGARDARPRVGLDTADFNARLDAAEARLRAFGSQSASPRLGASGGGAGGSGEGGLFGMLPGGGMTALIGAGIGLSPGLGGAATGLGLLGGAGFLGLGGIAGAVSAAHQASQSQGQTPQQLAATAFSNQVAQQQAGEQIGNARSQAEQDAITSARSIEQAQETLASVQRSTAQSQVQALQSVQQAEQGVEEANYGLSQAQYQMNQAWEAARENLAQLNDQLADSKLNVQQAQLGIQQALLNQRQVDQNAYSTALDRQQAALGVEQAQQRLKDAQDQATASQYKADQANKAGVAGSQQVLQAKQALTAAQYAQTNAQQQYANAQTNLKNTELNNALQLKQAQQQLSAAQEQAAYQRMVDARNVADAERNLTNTIKQQQLQAAATASTQNQAANQFAQDMAKLTPAARGVVNQILGMKGAFTDLQKIAQNAIAPGVSVFLTGLSKLLPEITGGVGRMGSVLGQTFASLGKAMQSPAGANVLKGLIDNGVKFAQVVIPAIGRFVGALAEVGAKKGAVDGIAGLIGGLADGLGNIVKAVSPFVGSLSTVFATVGKYLQPIGTLIGTIVGSLGSALAPVLQALLPGVQSLADALGQGLSTALQAIGPMLVPVGQAITAIFEAVAPLLPSLGQLVAKLAQALTPILQAIVPIIRQLAGLLAKDLVDGLLQVVTNLMPIVPAAGKLITSLMPVVSLVLDLAGVLIGLAAKIIGPVASALAWLVSGILDLASHWKVAVGWIEQAGLWLWHNVFDPMFHGIAEGAVWLYNFGIYPLWTSLKTAFGWIESAASWLWHNVFDPLWQGIEGGVRGFLSTFQTIWDTLKAIFENPVSFVIDTVYNNGIVKLWDDIAGAFGASSLELKPITGFADGGPVTGGTPGKDSVPALLMPGERVLSVPQVAMLGGQSGIDRMVGAAQPVYQGGVAHAADGWSWNPLTDLKKLGSSVWDGLKGVVLGGLRDAATPVIDGLEKLAKAALGTTGVGGMLDQGVNTTGNAILTFLGGKDAGAKASGGGAIGGTIPTGQRLSIIDQALAAAGVPPPGTKAQWEAGLNTLITRESGWNASIVNTWDINAQEGHPSTGLAQVILPTFLEYVPAALKGRPLTDSVANVAAAVRYIVADYGNITNVQQANANMPPKGYDNGGWLMPGTIPVNGLGKPEAVLTPEESEAFVAIVKQLTGGGGTAALGSKTATVNFYGTQYPNAEQMAAIERQMAMALGG